MADREAPVSTGSTLAGIGAAVWLWIVAGAYLWANRVYFEAKFSTFFSFLGNLS